MRQNEIQYKNIAEQLVSSLIRSLFSICSRIENRELTNPHLPKLIPSSLNQKWMLSLELNFVAISLILIFKKVFAMSKLTTKDLDRILIKL